MFLVFVLAIIVISNISIPIDIEAASIEIARDDPNHIEYRTVMINGRYSINVFSMSTTFSGTIKILEYPETHRPLSWDLVFQNPSSQGFRMASLFYPREGESWADMNVFGFISSRFLMRDSIIVVHAPYLGAGASSRTIAVGASTPEEARERIQQHFRIE
ncbi:MAG: hypothetical protein FWE21_04095 [Defluviitaleaceae bacterium]|nr:hypothetical protein [Defluviitaleaceae bacterium]